MELKRNKNEVVVVILYVIILYVYLWNIWYGESVCRYEVID